MIELIAAAVTGAVVGGFIREMMGRTERNLNHKLISEQRNTIDAHWSAYDRVWATLTALRSNCFIPDERGVKVRYSEASVARRLKAETPRTDKV